MFEQKQPLLIVTLVASLAVILALVAGRRVLHGDGSLLRTVSVEATEISPNADGIDDVTHINYEVARNARVSIYFEDDEGRRFHFREDQARAAGEYRAPFSGVVEAYHMPGEQVEGELVARLLQDGVYTWTVEATDEDGVTERRQGQVQIVDADPQLPQLQAFNVQPTRFTPNQDGVGDLLTISFDLTKEANVRVFLRAADGREVRIHEGDYAGGAESDGPYHIVYDAGVPDGFAPPTNGVYTVEAVAEDREGQRVRTRLEEELVIEHGGAPLTRIYPAPAGNTVRWEATAVPVCDTLWFNLTVENYGTAPIRTSGPPPGTVYDSDWDYESLGWTAETGVFRVGIGFENELVTYPFRWAVGDVDDLQEIDGHYYLMPGERAVVSGGIRMTDVFGVRNPQPVWAGLIHEGIGVGQTEFRVDPVAIQVDVPDEAHMPDCEPREIPDPALSFEDMTYSHASVTLVEGSGYILATGYVPVDYPGLAEDFERVRDSLTFRD
ncbi:MAG TPA: hypothetical protein VK879_18010 [Candidatus Sulfomarinibacteraceae bacterium]|nr:hypothetical protein [Candidatus Sulfomarinibacteraceae bacterium]